MCHACADSTANVIELLATWAPIIIAVAALVYGVRSDKRSRRIARKFQERAERHDKLSLRPYLSGKIVIGNTGLDSSVTIANSGAGPAVLKRFGIGLSGDDEFPDWTDERLKATLTRAGLDDTADYRWTNCDIGKDFVIGPGCEIELFEIGYYGDSDPDKHSVDIGDALKKLHFHVRYESVFGDSWLL